MRILQINKFFYVKGGSERYFFDVSHALAAAGHSVIPFSMQHARNEPSEYARHFVSEVDFSGGGGLVDRLRAAVRFVYSTEARDRLRALVEEVKPDVAHLHNVAHQLTPAIIDVLSAAQVPIVQTMHDYKLICSSYLLFANGEPCERCEGGAHFNAVRTSCHHGSRAKSVLGYAEMAWHARRGSYDGVDRFLCPSQFLADKCAQFGVARERLDHLPYFLDADRYEPDVEPGTYSLYMGRISREKGILTLLEALGEVPGARLLVAGEGPESEAARAAARPLGDRVTFVGHLAGDALHDTVRGANLVIVPSEWYENLPYAVLESFALGKPVLGARIGGIPELVRPGETGDLFDSGDSDGLARAWRGLLDDRASLRDLGAGARHRIESEFGPSGHLDRLLGLYAEVAA